MKLAGIVVLLALAVAPLARISAGDWPQFRYDSGRTAAAPDELPAELTLC